MKVCYELKKTGFFYFRPQVIPGIGIHIAINTFSVLRNRIDKDKLVCINFQLNDFIMMAQAKSQSQRHCLYFQRIKLLMWEFVSLVVIFIHHTF